MNLDKLKQAEEDFLKRYPEGFQHPDMLAVAKKHKMDQMIGYALEHFDKDKFTNDMTIAGHMVQMIKRSSMISLFEKPKFRDSVNEADPTTISMLAYGLREFLHGNQKQGLESLVEVLTPLKLAKWSLITIIPNYYKPDDEVFVKPTTAKGVIEFFELEGLNYKPKPSWEFYQRYRAAILEMRQHVNSELAPNNAAFCGFLMMSMNP